ncbi:hypothetical protein VPH35_040765 [Triticum aestivum]|uniref:Uncharacterized protein n=1 Tax=Aegilops tauschii TaxID=37682 RepID=R7W3T0_AEGTA
MGAPHVLSATLLHHPLLFKGKPTQCSRGSNESLDNTLLIDTLAREHGEAERKKEKWALSSGKHAVSESETGVLEGQGPSKYLVQSPDSSMDNENEVIPTPPLVTEENLRFSLRNAQTNLMRIDEKAAAVAKKRDLEDFASIDILRELKKSRANILKINTENARDDNKSGNLFLINAKGDKTPLNMEWGDERDLESDTNEYTLVKSRKKRTRKPTGAGKKGMSTCFSDLIKDYPLDFLALQETMKKNFHNSYFRKIDPYDLFAWRWSP